MIIFADVFSVSDVVTYDDGLAAFPSDPGRVLEVKGREALIRWSSGIVDSCECEPGNHVPAFCAGEWFSMDYLRHAAS